MKICEALAAALVTFSGISAAAPAVGQGISVQRFGLYVPVADVDRSVVFYEALFGKGPQVRTPALVGFDVAGGLFGVVSREAYAPGTQAGGSVRPYLRVTDIDAAFAHVSTLARVESGSVVTEGPFRFFRFSDPDGNVLEIFSFTQSR